METADSASASDLGRFLRAQDEAYASALHEVRAGAKRSHGMWYVFPQLAGLGRSASVTKPAPTSSIRGSARDSTAPPCAPR